MDKLLTVLASILALGIGITFIWGIVTTVNYYTQQDSRTTDQTEESYEDMFVDSCSAEGVSEPYCECGWDKLRDNYTVGEIAQFGINEEYPDNFYDIIGQCTDKL